MATKRIEVLRDILLRLHNGESAESVQAEFDEHFFGVSAIEISLMEHELMNSDSGVTFEDVMKLCNVHANLFKGAIKNVEVEDSEHPGHPVQVFKQENLALRAAIIRVRRILDNYTKLDEGETKEVVLKGLLRQLQLLGKFDIHYKRKEELMFPIMEKYGHDAPPKVMWGVDDEIRDLFKLAKEEAEKLPNAEIAVVKEKFEVFVKEFEEMIFKEESILLMILLEAFTQDDWLSIAKDSDTYGYAIIRPQEEWIPHRENFENTTTIEATQSEMTKVIQTPEGEFTITYKPKEVKEKTFNRDTPQKIGNGYLSLNQMDLILNHLPMEITFVNKEEIFQYYNNHCSEEEMIFKRTPGQVGRNVELCHPPKYLEKVKTIMKNLRSRKKDKYEMWFKSESRGKFVHVTYAGVYDENGEFQGVLEYVQDIAPYREIDSDYYRGIE
ncbi:DUF438 domain-containing protein [Gemella parahaemolysans]